MSPPPYAGGKGLTNIFANLFEVISAYGTNGLSLGWPGKNYSLCGEWTTLSKIIICLIMLLGRHRTMPRKIDPALARSNARAEALIRTVRGELYNFGEGC